MIRFDFDKEKGVAAALYVVQQLMSSRCYPGIHKIFKIFYFADQKHISKFGRPIVGDHYIAMKYGPVPSCLYDILRAVRGDGTCLSAEEFRPYFEVEGNQVKPLQNPDMDELSESELECLNASIEENKKKGFGELTRLSHDAAYDRAQDDSRISLRDIAKTAGTSPAMISYMSELAENRRIFKDGCQSR
ncbi:MAG: SocA family protein [Geopsychrobacter sp.]|nr:SocA family protein [Geopsychrobacter sp.]